MHYFWKKDAFGAVERRLLKKNTWKIFQDSAYWKLFGLVIFSSYSSKACKTSFYFFLKKLALFLKKRRFWCSGKTFRKKTLENFSSILPYLKLFGLAIYSRYSSNAWGKTSIKRNTWEIFQFSALFETFWTWGRRNE